MGRRSILAVALLVAGLAALLLRDRADDPLDGAPHAPDAADAPTAPDLVESPALAAAPARDPGAAPARPPRADRPAPTEPPLPPAVVGDLTVLLDLPDASARGTDRVLHLVLTSAELDVWRWALRPDADAAALAVPEGGATLAVRRLPSPPPATSPRPLARISGLAPGGYVVECLAEPLDDPAALAWRPVVALLGSSPAEVLLPALPSTARGTLRLLARQGAAPIGGAWTLDWEGVPWRRASSGADPLEVVLPAGTDVELAFDPGQRAVGGRTAAGTARLAPGETSSVVVEFPAAVPVTLRALRPGGTPAPRASFTLWRTGEMGGPGHVASQRHAQGDDGPGVWTLALTPGRYEVLAADVAPYFPVFHGFEVAEGGPVHVDVSLSSMGPEATCLLQGPDGKARPGYGLWLGRVDGATPAHAATALVTSGEDGVANFGPLPDGEYLVADYGMSVWRTVRVEAGRTDPAILRLPPAGGFAVGARVSGTVRGPAGERIPKGLVSVGPRDGWAPYAHFQGGKFELRAPAGEMVLTVHHTWFELSRFATYERPLVVEEGQDQVVEVRLAPRAP